MTPISKPLLTTLGLLLLIVKAAFPQADTKATLLNKVSHAADTALVNAYIDYGNWWEATNMDSAAAYYQRAGKLATSLEDAEGQLRYYANYTYVLNQQGKLDQSLQLNLDALEIAKRSGSKEHIANCLFNIGHYNNLGNYDKAVYYYFLAAGIMEKSKDTWGLITVYGNIAGVFTNSKQYEKAIKYNFMAYENARKLNDSLALAKTLINKGNTEYLLNRTDDALKSVSEGMQLAQRIHHPYLESIALNTLAYL